MTREEKQKAIYVLKKSAPVFPLKKPEEFNDYLQSINQVINWLEQESILDKIRAEIMDTGAYEQETNGKTEFLKGINYCLGVIDKYKVESEE